MAMTSTVDQLQWIVYHDHLTQHHSIAVQAGPYTECAEFPALPDGERSRIQATELMSIFYGPRRLTAIESAVYHRSRDLIGNGAVAAASVHLLRSQSQPSHEMKALSAEDILHRSDAVGRLSMPRPTGYIALAQSPFQIHCIAFFWSNGWQCTRTTVPRSAIEPGNLLCHRGLIDHAAAMERKMPHTSH